MKLVAEITPWPVLLLQERPFFGLKKAVVSNFGFFCKRGDFFLAFSRQFWYIALNLSGERKLIGSGVRRKLTDFVFCDALILCVSVK